MQTGYAPRSAAVRRSRSMSRARGRAPRGGGV